MGKNLGLEVPTSTGQLLLALCWSLICNQKDRNDNYKSANDK
jgi:hypothetical protein